ncbi:unnamed protein product [Microthlaspi erraticum]|uniref:Retrotransposon gag domain-containing protein n=1 Tax=Microthlaspi erraticum TaxID=1685480 RepID=A0A6D2JZD1_9BRAS|nr:unnamed protein product [Microthlaspi erraticum]
MNRRLDEVDERSIAPPAQPGIDESTRRYPEKPAHPQAPPDRSARKSSTQNRLLHRRRRPQEVANRVQPRHEREKYKSTTRREANYCQVFVEHMAKDALTWFSNLPAESIDNFDDLTNAFPKALLHAHDPNHSEHVHHNANPR